MGTIGATFFVIGVGFLYMATGTLNMADIAIHRLPELPGDRVVEIGFAFILVGLGLKAALFPLHLWLPGAYAYAPSFVTTFLARQRPRSRSTPSSASASTCSRWARLCPQQLHLCDRAAGHRRHDHRIGAGLVPSDVRRLLAYSSVAQVGYMMLGLGMARPGCRRACCT
jgi:multicomponent Na+:H+ antiporter subunit D